MTKTAIAMRHPIKAVKNIMLLTVNPLTANDALPNYPSTAKAVNAVT